MQHSEVHPLTEIVIQVFQLNGLLLSWGDDFVAWAGLTSARWQMLGALALSDKSMTAPQVAERMGVTRQGAQKQLNLLLNDGLVVAHDNRAHKRSPLYQMTEKGVQLYQEIQNRWFERALELSQDLNEQDLSVVQKTLNHLIAAHLASPPEKDSYGS